MSLESISFPDLLNVRDLGGFNTRDGQQTRWKAFLRTDDPSQLTAEGVQAILDYGVRTVIDLRWAAELKKYPNPLGVKERGVNYQHLSLLSESEEDWMTRRPAVKEQWNCLVLETAQPELRAVLGAIAKAPQGGVLFHCMAGKDRTGIIASLLLALAEVEAEEIAKDYGRSTTNLWESYFANAAESEREKVKGDLRCPPEQIHNMLAYLESDFGGVKGYMQTIGLSEAEIEQIRGRLR
jgi:protein-tyrosine phosphatase